MKRLLLLVLALNASVVYAQTLPDISAFSQQQIFENWVQKLGVPTAGAGALVCGLVVGAVGAAGGTKVGGFVGEQMNNLIFSGE